MDNQVRPTRPGGLEALMNTIQDRFLMGMVEQRIENKNKNTNTPRLSLRLKKPSEMLGFIYEEIPTFDVEYAREVG
jgi:hypothetical protein